VSCDPIESTPAKITVGYSSQFLLRSHDRLRVLDRVWGVSDSVITSPTVSRPTSSFRHVNSSGGPASVEVGGSWGNGKARKPAAEIGKRRCI
jgi:hypothetical protein